MRVVAIIQARLESTRLPYKVLMAIKGKPMVGRVIERVKQSKLVDEIVLAAPRVSPNRVTFGNIAEEYNVKAYFGSEDNLLDRYYQAATKFEANIIVRITSDCPLIDPGIIDQCINLFVESNSNYVANDDNLPGNSYPTGMDVEVFGYGVLSIAWNNATELSEKEHVPYYIIKRPELFRIVKLSPKRDLSQYQWSVNTEKELEFVRWVYRNLGEDFCLEDIIKLVGGRNGDT